MILVICIFFRPMAVSFPGSLTPQQYQNNNTRSSSSLLAHCGKVSLLILALTLLKTLCSSADHTRIWKRTKREREKLKVNMTPNNISQSTRGFCILYSSTYRNYETCIACCYLFDCFNCSTAEITETQVHPKWEGTIQVSLTFIVFFSN